MLPESRIRELLSPFELSLSSEQVSQLGSYLDLLLTWNKRINLTSVRTPEECVTRHFGESLFVATQYRLRGSLLDVGSGAGFPGLALKLCFPDLMVTLLEPVAKKRAFLKEVSRNCGFGDVEVRGERLEEFLRIVPGASFDNTTSRAVGNAADLAEGMTSCLKYGGREFLWLSERDSDEVAKLVGNVAWEARLNIPLSRSRQILCGLLQRCPKSDA